MMALHIYGVVERGEVMPIANVIHSAQIDMQWPCYCSLCSAFPYSDTNTEPFKRLNRSSISLSHAEATK